MYEVAVEDLKAKALSLLGVGNVEDREKAFEATVTALAAICKSLPSRNLRSIIRDADFPQMKSLGRLSTNHIALLSRLVQNKEAILVENDIYENQVGVQKLINRQRRKRLAAYFTKAKWFAVDGSDSCRLGQEAGSPS